MVVRCAWTTTVGPWRVCPWASPSPRCTPTCRSARSCDRLLIHSRELLDTVAGSISLVDPARGRYDKIAENGVACRLGQSFPLDEGATGQAVARRMPVVIDDYSDVRGGHLPPGHPVGRGAAAAVPLWWRGEVIGVNVAFAGRRRRFTTAEVDAFELLTQSVAAAVVKAGAAVPSLAGLLREHGRVVAGATGVRTVVTEVGPVRPVPDDVAAAAADLVALVRRAAALRDGPVAVARRRGPPAARGAAAGPGRDEPRRSHPTPTRSAWAPARGTSCSR